VEVANAVSHVDFRHVTVAHTGGYALWFHGATNSITVQYGTLRDLGAGGVRIGEPRSGAISSRSLLASNIIVADSVITDAGHIIESGAGVLLQQAASCLIHHNNIFNLFYTGVSTGWTWGYAPTSNNNIIVRENRIYNIGRGLLSDMGCVYNLGTSPGTVVDHNICHDVQSFGYGGWGLYSDEGTSYVKWSNNIVYRTKGAPYHQHYGIHNSVTNNVLAFPQYILGEPYPQANGDFAAVRSSPSPTGYESLTSFTLMTNIVYIRNASSSLFFATTTQAFINVTADYNVYFNAMQPTASLRFPCWNGMSSWSAWQALGEDLHSVLADPQFVSPDSYDFSDLQKTSPAIALGFDPIDTSRVGPRP
jgi:hypothetical protein